MGLSEEELTLYREFSSNHGISLTSKVHKGDPQVSFVIPFRGSARLNNLTLVIRCIRAQTIPCEIILSEEDEIPLSHDFGEHVLRVFRKWTGPFRRSHTINSGARFASTEIVVPIDTDILVPENYAERVVQAVEKGYEGGTLVYRAFHAGRETSAEIIEQSEVPELISGYGIWYECHGCTGFCRKDVFFDIGGYCEDFVGYGCEDSDFMWKLNEQRKIYLPRELDILHLYHDRCEDGWGENSKKLTAMWEGRGKPLPWGEK